MPDLRFGRLLVTSHRPLPAIEARDERLPEHGICLVMGHPSLAGAMKSYLGVGWQVGALYDVSVAEMLLSC